MSQSSRSFRLGTWTSWMIASVISSCSPFFSQPGEVVMNCFPSRIHAIWLCLLLFLPGLGWAQATEVVNSESPAATASEQVKPKRIAIETAGDHVNQLVIIEMTVKSSYLKSDRSICFLNSEKNYRDAKNFPIVIKGEKAIERFVKADIADPARHFFGKKIRVTGKIQLHHEKPQILVADVKQIEVQKQAEAKDKKADDSVKAG